MIQAQVLTADQMRAAEQALFDSGISIQDLMETAAGGAAEWVRRIAAGRNVTVLCGPGNNGGDGYVIARRLREACNAVRVVAPIEPKTDAATEARRRWDGKVETAGKGVRGDVFVDCLFGTGLARPLNPEHALLLRDLADHHAIRIAVDCPSGVASDTGELLNDRLPKFDVTLALGAWKFAHWSLPGRSIMGRMKLVPIGIDPVEGAAELIAKPHFSPPPLDSHKYRRGLLAVVGGAMPGAALLATEAAQRSGAGYVKLLGETGQFDPGPGLVVETGALDESLADDRIEAILVGPGLGRDEAAKNRLLVALSKSVATVLDADALMLLKPGMTGENASILATPHGGELEVLCRTFGVVAEGHRQRALALARASGMVICAKGPDTVIATPEGQLALAPPAPSWLSVAGTGDVLAGIAASRLATDCDPFTAACEAVWLHGEAARMCGAVFTPEKLAQAVPHAFSACL